MLLSLDGTLVVQLVNFIIFLVILNVIFLKPVGSAIAARRAYIDKVGADIAQFEYDLKALRVQADERRAAARRKADATAAGARATPTSSPPSSGAKSCARKSSKHAARSKRPTATRKRSSPGPRPTPGTS